MNDFPISRYLCVESRSPLCCSQFRLNSRPRVARGPKPIGPCLQWSCICRGACSTQCKNKTIRGDWIIWKHTIQSAGLHRIWVSRIVLVDPRRGNGKDLHPFVIQFGFIFMDFQEKLAKIIDWHPLVWEILDPQLHCLLSSWQMIWVALYYDHGKPPNFCF